MSTTHDPILCTPRNYREFAGYLPRIGAPSSLLGMAVAISNEFHGLRREADVIDQWFQLHADAVRSTFRSRNAEVVMAHLHQFLFEEQGYGGSIGGDSNPLHHLLTNVMDSKRGSPTLLCLVYRELAIRLGLCCHGVNLPGQFMVSVQVDGETPMLVDPHDRGRVLTKEEARHRDRALCGDEIEWSDDYLKPATHRLWITRVCQNLIHCYGSRQEYDKVGALLELEMVLWPEEVRLKRDLALVLARAGLFSRAHRMLSQYLKAAPDDPQHDDLQQLLSAITTTH